MEAKVRVFAPIRLATIRYSGPYGQAINRFWQSFNEARFARGWNGETYGIARQGEHYIAQFDDPNHPEAQSCRYDAGVAVGSDVVIDAAFEETVLQGGRYAVCEFFGTPATIGAVWEAAIRAQSAAAALSKDGRPMFEWYRATDVFHADGHFSCALCIPTS